MATAALWSRVTGPAPNAEPKSLSSRSSLMVKDRYFAGNVTRKNRRIVGDLAKWCKVTGNALIVVSKSLSFPSNLTVPNQFSAKPVT